MPPERAKLQFGLGLDRLTGEAAVDQYAMQQLENVDLYAGRLELAGGLQRQLLFGWGTDVVAVFPVTAQGLFGAVIFDAVSRDVRLYLTDSTFSAPTLVGTIWSALDASGTLPPSVIWANAYQKVAIAHDEASLTIRQATQVFDTSALTLTTLAQDLNRTGTAHPVKFRGVFAFLQFLGGWGYGTFALEDSPHTFRISEPGLVGNIGNGTSDDPANANAFVFVPEHYFQVGFPGDPLIGAQRAGNVIRLAKLSQAFFLEGSSHVDFGISKTVDQNFGDIASKLAVEVNGSCFCWSHEGPRVSTGGPSLDLEPPLDLSTDPDNPATSGATRAFSFYDSDKEKVVFVFNDVAYQLHLRDAPKRWSKRRYATSLNCAARLYAGSGVTVPVVLPPSWSAPANLGSNINSESVTYHSATDTFVACGTAAPYIRYSTDGGQTWNDGTAPAGAWFRIRSNGTHVLMVDEFGLTASSTDGQTFVAETSAMGFNSGLGLCWDEVGLRWCMCGLGGVIQTAPDATPGTLVFTKQTGADAGDYWCAAAHGGTIVLGGDNHVQISTNAGVAWTAKTPPLVGGHTVIMRNLAYFPAAAKFVGVGADNTTSHGVSIASTDATGGTWSAQDAGLGNLSSQGGAAADATRAIAVEFGATGTQYQTTADGTTLVTRSLLASFGCSDVAYRSSPLRWVAVGLNTFMYG